MTSGKNAAVNVTIQVDYDPCGANPQVATFVNQIAISPGNFSAAGDSGSLIVQNSSTCPRAVGLLFAGSSFYTFANPIDDVLNTLDVSMVGCTGDGSSGGPGNGKGGGRKPKGGRAQVDGVPAQAVEAITAAKERAEKELFQVDGVVGTGVANADAPGHAAIEIYVEKDTPLVRKNLPNKIEGHPVRIIETGKIVAY